MLIFCHRIIKHIVSCYYTLGISNPCIWTSPKYLHETFEFGSLLWTRKLHSSYVAVAFATLFYPAEARVAIENAGADSTPRYASSTALKGNIKEVDLNETPSVRTRKLQLRLQSLLKIGMIKCIFHYLAYNSLSIIFIWSSNSFEVTKTPPIKLCAVENGRRFFPHCSEVLDKYLDDDMPDVFVLEKGTEEEQRAKKARFMELKDEVQKAFHKDMAENNQSGFSSALSSTSSSARRESLNHKVRRKWSPFCSRVVAI